MKRLISIVALLAIATPAFAATKTPRPSHITRTSDGSYDVTYNYTDKAKSGWYAAARAELSLLNWTNKYSSDSPTVNEALKSDDFSFEPLFSANLAFGKRINYFWRAELEAGYISKFTDEDEGYKFALSVPYAMFNGYYDFNNGIYLGAGIGVAFPETELSDDEFTSGGGKKMEVSPMGALMAGYSYKLDDNLVLDLRYRLAGFYGTTQKRTWVDDAKIGGTEVGGCYLKNKMGLVLSNSISVGLRYEF
ncbi:MAG: hypothetical protein J6Y49_00185 [Alphaproteobacteria bacterium]|nr:hypothetical protein [Alphaproteobacteria bacterium]